MNLTLQKATILVVGALVAGAAIIESRFLHLPTGTTGFVYLFPYLFASAVLSLIPVKTRLFGVWGLSGMVLGFIVTITGAFIYGLFK